MAQRSGKKKKTAPRVVKPRPQPRTGSLPGMEDHAIKPLDDVAAQYADIRDQRMVLTKDESALKEQTRKLMAKYSKTIYRHNGIEIRIVAGEDDVKVKIKKPVEEGEAEESGDDGGSDTVEFTGEA